MHLLEKDGKGKNGSNDPEAAAMIHAMIRMTADAAVLMDTDRACQK